MRFAFIQAHVRIWPVVTMCRVLAVSKAGYYAWAKRPLCQRVETDRVLTARIREIQRQVKQRYGSPRVRMELRALGVPCGKHRVARLMREAGVNATQRRSYRVTTQASLTHSVVDNVLDRRFDLAAQPAVNQTWAGDITYLATREGWLYLAVVLDLASRRVIGWALRTRLAQELALAALDMALEGRRPSGGLLHHSDRGSQYTSLAYQERLQAAGVRASMSRKGNCWDNAVVESFFATLTKELLGDTVFESRSAASRAVFEFIEMWYNRQRRHSTLGYRTPVEFEEEMLKAS